MGIEFVTGELEERNRDTYYVSAGESGIFYSKGDPMPENNQNWDQMICDGGLAIPYTKSNEVSSDLFLDLAMEQGLIRNKIIAFWTDPDLKRG